MGPLSPLDAETDLPSEPVGKQVRASAMGSVPGATSVEPTDRNSSEPMLLLEPRSRDTSFPRMFTDTHPLFDDLRKFIESKDFPCVGAKSALATGNLKTIVACSIESAWNDLAIHAGLLRFVGDYERRPQLFQSVAVVFEGPTHLSEPEFETAMWHRLQSMSDKDEWLAQAHDPRVSADPESPHFSLSFGGQGFFVVGLHPNASRKSRRFKVPVLIFNLHDQFERLRSDGRYEKLRTTILARDEIYSGSPNPMIARHGDESAARQFSGRFVDNDWRCPFSRAA